MNRILLVVSAALAAGSSGCMTEAHYVEKGRDQGVVAIPEWSNEWPSHYEDAAIDLIKAHVGPNYEIIERFPVVINNPNTPRMSSDPSSPGPNSSSSKTEYRIVYRKRVTPPGIPFGGPMPAPYGARPLPPAGAGLGNTVPVGGYVPGSMTGPGPGGPMSPVYGVNSNIPSVAPVPYQPAPGGSPYSVNGVNR
jgi:hypothetical protein